MRQSIIDSNWFLIFFPMLLFASTAGGILFARWFRKKNTCEGSGIENAVISIFGLIISFTFLMADNAHRERYTYIHQEANAANILYRYSKEMPDSFKTGAKLFLTAFLNNQLSYDKNHPGSEELLLSNAAKISEHYLNFVASYKKQHSGNEKQIDKMDGCFDDIQTSFSRHAYSYLERTPVAIMLLLIITSLFIGFLAGFMNGIKARVHYLLPFIYFLLVTLIMLVIRDLNNPLIGFIKPNYQVLQTTYEQISR